MRVENLITTPLQTTYKAGVYGALGFVGVFLAGFVLWSLSCFGGACVDLATHLS